MRKECGRFPCQIELVCRMHKELLEARDSPGGTVVYRSLLIDLLVVESCSRIEPCPWNALTRWIRRKSTTTLSVGKSLCTGRI